MKPNKLDYTLHCLHLKWKYPDINKRKVEVINHGHGHYSFKETILNPYTFEDYCRDEARHPLIKKIIKFFR